mmetsp:Transcript_32712/g.104258  ORF Transcript_32712/g.104258 Transcript_32712/m.104258 type:complete len:98 (+) Transcript_32712:586-879(+)
MPFRPLLVAGAHVAGAEYLVARHVQRKPELRKLHMAHLACTAFGSACYIAEDVRPDVPFFHAGWHVGSTLALMSMNSFLRTVAEERAEGKGGGSKAP